MKRHKEEHYIMIKESIQEEDATIINIYAPNKGFTHSSVCKESACNGGDPDLIPESGRSSREGIGYPLQYSVFLGVPCGSAGKEFACNAGDLDSIPRMGRSPGEGKGYPLQYSGLENSMDPHGVAKNWTH